MPDHGGPPTYHFTIDHLDEVCQHQSVYVRPDRVVCPASSCVPEILSARDILTRAAALRGTRPRMVPIPVLSPRLSGAWLRLVTRADWSIARRLVDGLTEDLLMDPVGLYAICPDLPRTPFEEAARRALAEEEAPGVGGRLWEAVARRVAAHPAATRGGPGPAR
jgi:hypothetical protein